MTIRIGVDSSLAVGLRNRDRAFQAYQFATVSIYDINPRPFAAGFGLVGPEPGHHAQAMVPHRQLGGVDRIETDTERRYLAGLLGMVAEEREINIHTDPIVRTGWGWEWPGRSGATARGPKLPANRKFGAPRPIPCEVVNRARRARRAIDRKDRHPVNCRSESARSGRGCALTRWRVSAAAAQWLRKTAPVGPVRRLK